MATARRSLRGLLGSRLAAWDDDGQRRSNTHPSPEMMNAVEGESVGRLGIGDPDERVKWDDLAELRLITDLPSLLPLPTNELDLDSARTSSAVLSPLLHSIQSSAYWRQKEAVACASFWIWPLLHHSRGDRNGFKVLVIAFLCSPFSTPKF